ncbi:uncharacterized protein FIBRA_09459 [Fibroporia radiculosa]|uniref:Uncharacterized protein n=1 Tax=Fibroporia radiculosa TaxID=599839 RepID=J7RW27_9APHY|nr:uncharacterized protein FIBRA_09459 [Fibroporia radiculosa]CCM07125.1 predicted protein [Fibroporia radiculosa]
MSPSSSWSLGFGLPSSGLFGCLSVGPSSGLGPTGDLDGSGWDSVGVETGHCSSTGIGVLTGPGELKIPERKLGVTVGLVFVDSLGKGLVVNWSGDVQGVGTTTLLLDDAAVGVRYDGVGEDFSTSGGTTECRLSLLPIGAKIGVAFGIVLSLLLFGQSALAQYW